MGVRRAVETAKKIYGQGVYILGEIIHNESVTDEIKRLGTKIIDSPDEVDNGTVIIRSHGVASFITSGQRQFERLVLLGGERLGFYKGHARRRVR